MTTADRAQAIFGGFDGVVSAVGVVAPLIIAGASATAIVVAAVGLSINSAWSMGSGQYISDPQRRLRLAVVMGLATLAFSLLPALPFLLGGSRVVSSTIGVVLTLGTGVLIAELRPGGRRASYLLTFAVLGVGLALAIGWGFIAP